MKRSSRRAWAWAVLAGLVAGPSLRASEPGFEVALLGAVTDRRELEATDYGFGLRPSWRLASWIALDAEAMLAPGGLGGSRPFSSSRTEFLGGLRFGRDLGSSGAYGLLRGGVVRFGEAEAPFPCILIFPPPLTCSIAQGDTVPALEFGAGYQHAINERARLFVELRDQVVKFEGPVMDAGFEPRLESFWSHNPRLTFGVGWAF